VIKRGIGKVLEVGEFKVDKEGKIELVKKKEIKDDSKICTNNNNRKDRRPRRTTF
jgi:hypothetical protein